MRNTIGQRFQNRIDVPIWLERKQLTYAEKVLNTAYDNLIGYWPMWEPSGLIAYDLSSRGNNGAYSGVTLGQPGIGDGATCPLFDGINDVVNVFSAGLAADFNGLEGTQTIWARVSAAGVWTDGINRRIWQTQVDGANNEEAHKSAVANQIQVAYSAGGVVEVRNQIPFNPTDWFHVGMTWSASADEVIYYFDGLPVETDTALGVFAGVIVLATIGALNLAGAQPWDGFLAHPGIWTRPLTAAEFANLAVR